jgi:hypothetical protein
MTKITWCLPLKTCDETNAYEHHAVKSKRHRQQQFFVRKLFMHEKTVINLPCTVTFIRLGPRFMDEEDNLRMAFKWIKDQVGACLFPEKSVVYVTKKGQVRENKGHADGDKRVTWKYGQEKATRLSIKIEIEFLSDQELHDIGRGDIQSLDHLKRTQTQLTACLPA